MRALEAGSVDGAGGGSARRPHGGRYGCLALAFKADALRVGTRSEEVEGAGGRLASTEAAVTRVWNVP